MAVYQRPGVYVSENLNATPPSAGAETLTYGAFLGAINQGPVAPTLVTSWPQFVKLYGNFDNGIGDTLRLGVRSFLVDNNGGACYIKRVQGTGNSVATRSVYDSNGGGGAAGNVNTLQIQAASAGAWGNNLYFDIVKATATASTWSLIVYYGDATSGSIVERYTDLSMDSTNSRYAPTVVNAQSTWVYLTDLSDPANGFADQPVAITGAQLAGGVNATGGQTAADVANSVTAFDVIAQSLVINAPGITTASPVNTLIAYATARTDCFVVIDGGAANVADQLTLAASYSSSSYAAVYYPNILISDPTTTAPGVTRTIGVGAAVAGQYFSTDRQRGVFKAPAGLNVRIGGAVSVPALTNAELDSMNVAGAPVNAIRFVSGSGIVVMGARTLKQGYVDKYVPVRRSLIHLEKTLSNLTRYAVFEPNDAKLWRQLTATAQNFLNDFWRQGGLRGDTPQQAYYVLCNATNNPLTTVDAGEVHLDIGVALQRPAEFVVIKISQYDGGVTITTA